MRAFDVNHKSVDGVAHHSWQVFVALLMHQLESLVDVSVSVKQQRV